MRYPAFLNPNGKIGFIAPSFGASISPYRERFQRACERFSAEGYELVLGPNCNAACGIGKSNTPEKCAEEINDFFCHNRADVIIACGGGETMCEDMSYVDFAGITNAPAKWFMGYSDNTNLTFLLPTLCDTAAIYGPLAPSFGTDTVHESLLDAKRLFTGKALTVRNYNGWERKSIKTPSNPFEGYNITEPYCQQSFPKDDLDFSGRLLGGCLDLLSVLCGTRFDAVSAFIDRYREDGIIWFLEACDLTPMGVRRSLWQLKEAGWFRYVKGFLIGRPALFEYEMMGENRINAVLDMLSGYGVPVLMDLDIGHLPPMMPLICGAYANVHSDGKSVSIEHILR